MRVYGIVLDGRYRLAPENISEEISTLSGVIQSRKTNARLL